MSVKKEFNGLRALIISIMEKYPDTRSNDTLLYLQCCKQLGAKSLSDLETLNLSVVSVHKTRQLIQNKLGLWQPSEDVKQLREKRRVEIREYMGKAN